MKPLEAFVSTPLAQALGWTVLHSLWQGAMIAAVLAAVLSATRSSRARYSVAYVGMLAILIGFVVTLVLVMPESLSSSLIVRTSAFPAWKVLSITATARVWDLSLAAIAPWLAPFWIAGVLAFYLNHMAGWISVERLRRRGVCLASERWQKELNRLTARLHLSKPIQLLESSLAEAPIVLGHFRPLILMPVGLLAGLPAGQIEAILLHELAHVRRHDYLLNMLQRLVEGLLFYHPAIWWISRVIRAERENCCDDVVLSLRGNAHEYALALAALEQNRSSARESALAATGGNLVKRIRRLLYPKIPNGAWTPFSAAVILIAVAALSLAAWQPYRPLHHSPTDRAQESHNANSSYSKWLNEDVVYIIDDAERAAFEKLTTNDERDRFIEQFWLRRNPTPGTSENEFKKEHYRRIAFANPHFRTASGMAGWRTDRGHLYIVYGPPDEIESHKNAPNSYAVESWAYRRIEGIRDKSFVTFIDRTGRGDYRIAPGNAR